MRIGSHRLRVRRLCEHHRRRMRNEGLWDMFINHGAQIAFAKSLLDVVMDSAKDTKMTLSRAEESEEPEEQAFAQEALDEFVKTLDEAAKGLKHIDMSIYEGRRNGLRWNKR